MKRLTHLLLIQLCAALLTMPVQAATTAEQSYQKARDAYHALTNSSRKQMYRENWLKVFDLFQVVHEKHPGDHRGADALYMSGKTYDGLYQVSRLKTDAERAVALYVQMAGEYADSSLADDALLQAGELLEKTLDEPARAWLLYQRLVETFPKGDMYGKTRERLQALARHAPPPEPPAKPAPKAAAVTPQESVKAATAQGVVTSAAITPGLAGGGGSLTGIRFWSNPGYTRIVLDVSAQADFSAHFLAADPAQGAPPRLYVDLVKTSLDKALAEPTLVDDGLLRQIRTGKPQSDTVRVVLDLDSIGDYKVFPLSDPWRIVIDVSGEKGVELKRREPELHAPLPGSKDDAIAKVLKEAPKDQMPVHIPAAPASTSLRRVVVDAGHGGKDPGAVGPSGVLEKDVTLALAKELARELTALLGCEVILTRSGDVFLPLEERTAIANKVGADLFISVHANANRSREAFGIETYYLNFSKNDKAAAVAARENGTSLKQVSDLELILFDLMANAKINESSRLATEIQDTLVKRISRKYNNVRDLGVKQGPFYVLLGATMPSVLVETAFISHPREEKRLASQDFQKSTAEAIAEAIKIYALNNRLIAANP